MVFSQYHSYAKLDEKLHSKVQLQPFKAIDYTVINTELCRQYQLENAKTLLNDILISNVKSSEQFIAMAYAGHQFGHFTMLGDGRACLIGELELGSHRQDLHLKGCGKTAYSRNGDGNAAIGSVCREYLISEAIHALGIPTTRALAIIETGNSVMRESLQRGAMLLRIADSHIRVGTFQYARAINDIKTLRQLLTYSVQRHYPTILDSKNMAFDFLSEVAESLISLIVNWLRVGFIHGVMNTDNTAISGQTIDYGPCAFMEIFNPSQVFSAIDTHGRYAYDNQGRIVLWNICRLAECLLPIIDSEESISIEKVEKLIDGLNTRLNHKYQKMMANKLGFSESNTAVENLSKDFLKIIYQQKTDFTNSFSALENYLESETIDYPLYLSEWIKVWQKQLKVDTNFELAKQKMLKSNPKVIPRNHLVAKVISAIEQDKDYQSFIDLLERLKSPYHKKSGDKYTAPATENETVIKTYCGT